MKVICDRPALLDALNTVSGAVATRTPRVQLSCVRLTASKSGGDHVVLTGTDAEISIRMQLQTVEVKTPGDVLIPADRLRRIVSAEEQDPTLTFDTEGDVCTIRGQDATFKVFGFPPEDFPPIPDFGTAMTGAGGAPKARTVFSLPAGQLAALVARTTFATARESSRYAVNGVFVKRDGRKLELVATDGRRLAVCRATLSSADKDSKPVSCIIPSKALNQIQKLTRDPDEPVHLAITDSQVLVNFGPDRDAPRAALTSNLVEGTFPPYEDVIPKDHDKRVTFDRDAMASAVRRAELLTNEESRGVKMRFSGKAKQLELSARAAEAGEAQVSVDLKAYEGEDLEISFNPAYITDALKVIPEAEVILELKSQNKPGVVRCGADFVYVVMPVNLP